MAGVGVVIASSLSTGGFALLGVGFSNVMAARRERRQFRTETALELGEVERQVWGDDWTELEARLQRQETRLAIAGIPEDLVQALHDSTVFCWRDNYHGLETTGQGGISSELLDGRRKANRAIGAYLLNRGTRSSREELRREVVEEVQELIDDRSRAHLRNWTRSEDV
jgi:hypothetical protein